MDAITDWLIAFVTAENNPIGLLVLGASALIEYVFPPFPGDTVVLFGAILVGAYGWNLAAVFTVVMIGSVIGSMAAFYFGARLAARRERKGKPVDETALDKLIGKFKRWGPYYLILNRFLPGFRAVFFVAAGMSGMRPRHVLIWGSLSALLYNIALFTAGILVGANFDKLKGLASTWMAIVWITIGSAIVAYALFRLWKSRRAPE